MLMEIQRLDFIGEKGKGLPFECTFKQARQDNFYFQSFPKQTLNPID